MKKQQRENGDKKEAKRVERVEGERALTMSMIMYYFYNFCQLLTGLQFIFAAAACGYCCCYKNKNNLAEHKQGSAAENRCLAKPQRVCVCVCVVNQMTYQNCTLNNHAHTHSCSWCQGDVSWSLTETYCMSFISSCVCVCVCVEWYKLVYLVPHVGKTNEKLCNRKKTAWRKAEKRHKKQDATVVPYGTGSCNEMCQGNTHTHTQAS